MAATTAKRQRRKLSFSRRLLVGGALVLGCAMVLAACANFISRDDLTEVDGPVSHVERKQYWEDTLLYLRVQGTHGRFKYEDGAPGFADFEAAVAEGTPVRLWVETAALDLGHPAPIYEAEVDGKRLIEFDQTKAIHNRDTFFVMLLGAAFWFIGFWICHRATRPLPQAEEVAAYEARLAEIAERHWLLFAVVHVVTKLRQWGEQVPKFGDLAVAFFFFWILPLYMVFVYVTAQSYRKLVAVFCVSYWTLLVALPIAALTIPDFPGASEYPELGATASRIANGYILLNLAYGGALWLWGTLMSEPETAGIDQIQDDRAKAA